MDANTKPAGRNAFFFIIVTVTIDMVGLGLIIPVLPALLTDITGLPAREAVVWGGTLTATYAAMNFLFGPTLGNLSDRYGRRPVLLASLATLAVDYVIMGLAGSIIVLFIGRALAGISGATLATANAYIADTTKPDERGKAYGVLGAAFGFGFIIGPAVGGLLGAIDPRAPFFAAAGLAALNAVYGVFVLPESLPKHRRRPFNLARANPAGAFKHFSRLPMIAWLLAAFGLHTFAHSVYPSTWSFFTKIRFDWSEAEIGWSLAAVGVGAAVAQGALAGPAIKRLGAEAAAVFAYVASILALAAYSVVAAPWMVYAIIPLSALGGLTGPAMNTIMSNRTPDDAQGELQGAAASLNSVAIVFAPIVMTQTLHAFSADDAPVFFPGAAFLLAAVLTGAALIPLFAGLRAAPASDAAARALDDEPSRG